MDGAAPPPHPRGDQALIVGALSALLGLVRGGEINLAMKTETGLGQVWQKQFGRRVYVVLLEPKKS